MFELNAVQLREAIIRDIKVQQVPMIGSSPGMGKSAIVKEIADFFKLKLLDLRLSQCEPVDMRGFPDKEDGRMTFLPPRFFPLSTDEIPVGCEGWLLFLDEFNSGNKDTEAAAYKLILDRMIEDRPLHKNCAIVAAGNLVTDRAIVNTLSTATTSRIAHYRLAVDHNIWVDWANKNDIDHKIISFIKFKPEILHNFKPDTNELTFPSPRTWEFANRVVKGKDTIDFIDKVRLMGVVGESAAVEFTVYCEIYKSLPSIEQILKDPENGWRVPTEASEQYAVTTMLSHNINEGNISRLIKAIERLPMEFQVITFKDIYKRVPQLKGHRLIIEWTASHSSQMF